MVEMGRTCGGIPKRVSGTRMGQGWGSIGTWVWMIKTRWDKGRKWVGHAWDLSGRRIGYWV
jgi:hypothetical protein